MRKKQMTSKTHHYIHLNIKNIKLSDIKSCENPLDLLNNVINNDNYEQFITFSQNTDVVWKAFNKIVFKNNQYVTTIKQVKEFIDKCLTHYHQQTKNYFDNDEIFTLVYESNIPDDTVVTIEFEES
jgi:predicted HAD superfamily Cof-like phosphohydrolase